MNFDSETLITSFFPRITKKRGIHTDLAPSSSSNKRQRGHTSTTSRQGTKSRADEERRNTLDNGIISILHSPSVESTRQQTSERHMSLLPNSNANNTTSQTPKPNRSTSRTKRKTSIQTPPPTNGAAERQRLMELTPILPPFISRKSLDSRFEKALLPTPSTLGRSASYHNGHSGNERSRANQGQVLLSPTRPKRSDTSVKANVPVSIPSSQSQLMANAYCEDKHPLMPASTALPCKMQSPQYEVQPSPPNRIILNRRDKDSTSHDSQMFISSSQSQFLSPLDEHDHPQPSLIAPNPELDIIPSSQSQEKELRILTLEECHQSIRSKKQAMPQRTLSDELFSVSILQTGWSDCRLDFEHPIHGTADSPCVANQGDDSVTESESEPETKKKDSYYRDHSLTPMQLQRYGFSQLSTADIASLNEDSEYKDSRNSQQSSQALSFADQTSSIASLPGAVKEFQSMFGSDDESYPADFPMSLR